MKSIKQVKYYATPPTSINNRVVKYITFNEYALKARPATIDELINCDNKLYKLGFPELPTEYLLFLKVYGACFCNAIELYGPTDIRNWSGLYLSNIVDKTIDLKNRIQNLGECGNYDLLCLGTNNADYMTYNRLTQKYEIRSHEDVFTIWDEYDSFEDLFMNEL